MRRIPFTPTLVAPAAPNRVPATHRHSATSRNHMWALVAYLVVVVSHFIEHATQIVQVHVLGWAPAQAGGFLGLWLPGLAMTEVLHTTYNTVQLAGLAALLSGFKGPARRWWLAALMIQCWHLFEHLLLQVQFLTGHHLMSHAKQHSLLELVFPRVELHFAYNLLVFVPTVVATVIYLYSRRSQNSEAS